MTTELSLNSSQQIANKNEISMDDLKQLVVSSKTKQPTDAEMYVFKRLCETLGANPFIRDIHIVKYDANSPASFITGKDYFTKVARRQGASWEAGVMLIRNQQLIKELGSFKLPSDQLVGGWADVHTVDGKTFPIQVLLSEYDSNQSTWKKLQLTMIRKVALVQALREAYPEQFGGTYDSSEMQSVIDEKSKGDVDIIAAVDTNASPFEPSPTVNYAKELGATVTDVKPDITTTTVQSEPVITNAVPQILTMPEMPDSILCPMHNAQAELKEGKYGFYYSHAEPEAPKGWCNCSYDKPKALCQTEWLKAISETWGEQKAEEVKANRNGQNVGWWMAQLAGPGAESEITDTCIICDAKGEILVDDGTYTCIEHEEEFKGISNDS